MSGRGSHGGGRTKRSKPDEGSWDCTVCTFHNAPDAFKCLMCDTRKGTSTRKPKLNSHLEEQVEQVVRQFSHQAKKPRLSSTASFRDAPSPPSPASPFDPTFEDRPFLAGKGKGVGKGKGRGGAGAGQVKRLPVPVVEDDEEEDDDEDEEEEEEEEEEMRREEEKRKRATAAAAKAKAKTTEKKTTTTTTTTKKTNKTDVEKSVKNEETDKKAGLKTDEQTDERAKGRLAAEARETRKEEAKEEKEEGKEERKGKKGGEETERKRRATRLKNVDRSTAQQMAVTVNNITVIITDFKPKSGTATAGTTKSGAAEAKIKLEQKIQIDVAASDGGGAVTTAANQQPHGKKIKTEKKSDLNGVP